MSYLWTEIHKSAGVKKIALHEMADGFLINMIWSWPEADISQEITFFSPLHQAQEIAEQIFEHIGRLRLKGARQINTNIDPSSPQPPE